MGWKIPCKRAWQPTPVFLPGESNGQRSLAGYSPWDHKELNITEVTAYTHTHTHTNTQKHICKEVSTSYFYYVILGIMPVAERKPILTACWKLFY